MHSGEKVNTPSIWHFWKPECATSCNTLSKATSVFLEVAAFLTVLHLWKEVKTACSKIRTVWWVGKVSLCVFKYDELRLHEQWSMCHHTVMHKHLVFLYIYVSGCCRWNSSHTHTTTSLQCIWVSYSGLYHMVVTLPNPYPILLIFYIKPFNKT